jgi:serine protease DegQ
MSRCRAAVVVVVLLVALGACSTDEDQPRTAADTTLAIPGSSTQSVTSPIPDIVAKVQPSVVAIVTDVGQGSGVVWDSNGVIVTNDHVVAGARRIEVAFADGQRAPAQMVGTDPQTDLAVVRTSRSGLPAATFADALPPSPWATPWGSRTR